MTKDIKLHNSHKSNRNTIFRLCFCITLILFLCLGQFSTTVLSLENSNILVNQGVELYNEGNYVSAAAKWEKALEQYEKVHNLAEAVIVRENLAQVYQQLGATEKAIAEWNFLISYYQQEGNQQKVSRLLIEQAQAYNYLGKSTDTISLLCGNLVQKNFLDSDQLELRKCATESAIFISQQEKDYQVEAAAWGSLGEAYRLQGNYEEALIYLQNSQKIAQLHNLTSYLMASSNSLGNVHSNLAQVAMRRANSAQQIGDLQEAKQLKQEAIAEDEQALEYYQQSLEIALSTDNKLAQMNSLLNIIPIYYRQERKVGAQALRPIKSALNLLPELPETQAKVYATIKLVKLLQPNINTPTDCLELSFHPVATKLLEDGLTLAKKLQNVRAESFILGELGHLAECRFLTTNQEEDYQKSLNLTQQARWKVEAQLQAPDSLYLWEWQTGRILLAKGKTTEAVAAYTRAINILETIRDDILTANRDLQYDFRDRIEPIYRQLINLQLETVIPNNKFNSVLNNFEKLKIAELQDYLGDNCDLSVFNPRNVDFKSQNNSTAFFYSIVFRDRTALIANFPDGSQKLHWLNLDRTTLTQEINQFRIGLESYFDEQYDTSQAETIYQQLIAPFQKQLKQTDTKTLVFIHDGILRSVPMAALHNGNRFLIEEYAIANTPSLTLTETTVEKKTKLKALVVGLTNSATLADGSQFKSLPNVAQEIDIIQNQIPNTKSLLNQEFNLTRLQQELTLNNYSILHIATHGEFSNDPSENFLVTGDEQKITINDLDNIVRNSSPVEFLALTACQTAIGDERSALGLAGVAIQAGVKTALASLWSISDNKTPEIIKQFYMELQNDQLNKAEALQKAQVNLIKENEHPGFWAAFILIGNTEK